MLTNGVQEVPRTVATMIRAKDSQGQEQIPKVTPDVVSGVPHVRPLGIGQFPAEDVEVLDSRSAPVTCWSWSKDASSAAAKTEVLAGGGVPLSEQQAAAVVSLVTGSSSAGRTVTNAYVPYQSGRFVQVTGSDPSNLSRESLWWVGDTGVRYGIDTSGPIDSAKRSVAALGIGNPVPAPWAVIKMLPVGPVLSETEARLKHNFGSARPEGYRKAVRLMEMADKFGLPVITLVDTAGAYPGVAAEERARIRGLTDDRTRGHGLAVDRIGHRHREPGGLEN